MKLEETEVIFKMLIPKTTMELLIESCNMNPKAKELAEELMHDYKRAIIYTDLNNLLNATLTEHDSTKVN